MLVWVGGTTKTSALGRHSADAREQGGPNLQCTRQGQRLTHAAPQPYSCLARMQLVHTGLPAALVQTGAALARPASGVRQYGGTPRVFVSTPALAPRFGVVVGTSWQRWLPAAI